MLGKIVIKKHICKGCGYCVISCPKGCLSEGAEINKAGYIAVEVSDPKNCTGCAFCATICPDLAIEVWR